MKYLLLCISLFLILSSCRDEDAIDRINEVAELKSFITDSVISIPYDQRYIAKGGYLGNQYSYTDLTKLDNGDLLLVCSTEKRITDFSYKYLITMKSTDDGKTWATPQAIQHSVTDTYLNVSAPTLLNLGNNHIMLFFGMKYDAKKINIMYKETFDGGKTWGDDKLVYQDNQGYQTLNNDRVILANGRIIIPLAKTDFPDDLVKSIGEGMTVYYYYSDDFGASWQKSSDVRIAGVGLLEPGITHIKGNEHLMNIRTNFGKVLFARSSNNGQSWLFEQSNINSPSSPQKIIKLKDSGNLLMVWNNTTEEPTHHFGNRNPLSIAISRDNGYNWIYLGDIENNSANDFSYASLYQDHQQVYVSYFEVSPTHGYSVKLATIDKKYLQ